MWSISVFGRDGNTLFKTFSKHISADKKIVIELSRGERIVGYKSHVRYAGHHDIQFAILGKF